MKRRSFIATVTSSGLIAVSGCSNQIAEPIDLKIVNQRDSTVDVTVTAVSGDYEETFQVEANSGSITKEDVLPPKEQEIRVSTSGCTKTEYISPQGCNEPLVVLTIHDRCEIEFGGKKC